MAMLFFVGAFLGACPDAHARTASSSGENRPNASEADRGGSSPSIQAARDPVLNAPLSLEDVRKRGIQLYLYEQALLAAEARLPAEVENPGADPHEDVVCLPRRTSEGGAPFWTVPCFVGGNPAALRYRVAIPVMGNGAARLERFEPMHHADAEARRALEARSRALKVLSLSDASAHRVFVLPPMSGTQTGMDVYVLAFSRRWDRVGRGPHFRVELDTEAGGGKSITSMSLAPAGGDVSSSAGIEGREGKRRIRIEDGMGSRPSEIHVWLSMRMGCPVELTTPAGAWLIRGGRIERLEASAVPRAPARQP